MKKATSKKLPKRLAQSYTRSVLEVLVYEFPTSNIAESNKKIAALLKRKALGNYVPGRIERLRGLKNELQIEISKAEKSTYFCGPCDPKIRAITYVEMTDFDLARLTIDMSKKYPELPLADIEWFVHHAVFVYHLL